MSQNLKLRSLSYGPLAAYEPDVDPADYKRVVGREVRHNGRTVGKVSAVTFVPPDSIRVHIDWEPDGGYMPLEGRLTISLDDEADTPDIVFHSGELRE